MSAWGISAMKIRFGYELVYSCPQPVPMILMLHAHSSRSADLLRADRMMTRPQRPARDLCRRVRQHLHPDRGACRRNQLTADGLIQDSGSSGSRISARPGTCGRGAAARHTDIFAGQPLLRDRAAHGRCVAPVRSPDARLVAGPGGLRFRAPPHRLWLSFRAADQDGMRKPIPNARACAGITRTSPSRCSAASIFRRATAPAISAISACRFRCAHGFRGLAGSICRRRLAHLRSTQQSAPHRQDIDRARTRCRGCRDQHRIRAEHSAIIQGLDRRSRNRRVSAGVTTKRLGWRFATAAAT